MFLLAHVKRSYRIEGLGWFVTTVLTNTPSSTREEKLLHYSHHSAEFGTPCSRFSPWRYFQVNNCMFHSIYYSFIFFFIPHNCTDSRYFITILILSLRATKAGGQWTSLIQFYLVVGSYIYSTCKAKGLSFEFHIDLKNLGKSDH